MNGCALISYGKKRMALMARDTHKSQMTDVGNNKLLSNEDVGTLIGARTLLSKCVCV